MNHLSSQVNKKKLISNIFVLIVAFAVCYGYFSKDIYRAYDLTFHMNRLVGIKEAFQDRQFLPKIYPYTNNGFGYASPLFYCDLFLYPFAVLYYFGTPLVVSYKLMILFYVILTCLIVFKITERASNSEFAPFIITLVYMSCNYYLFDIYARAALGEIFAFCFIPIVIYETYRLIIKKQNNYIVLGLSFSLLLESHLISFVLYCFAFFVCLIVFVIKNRQNKLDIINCIKTVFKAIVVAILLSVWYLIPMLEQFMDQCFWVNELGKIYDVRNTAQGLYALINPFIRLDNVNDNFGENGIFTILGIGVLLPSLCLLYIKEKKTIYITVLLVFAAILSLFVYGIFSIPLFLNFTQFIYRLYILIFPILAVVALYCIQKQSERVYKVILIISSVYLLLNVFNMTRSLDLSNKKIDNYETRETIYDFSNINKDYNEIEMGGAEYLPVTLYTNYLVESGSIKEIKTDGYEDLTYDYERNFTQITFTYNSNERKQIMLPQSYYLGYKAYEILENGKKEIEVFSAEKYKQVSFYIEEGVHTYTCSYEGTIIQKVTLAVSFMSAVLIAYILIKKKPN